MGTVAYLAATAAPGVGAVASAESVEEPAEPVEAMAVSAAVSVEAMAVSVQEMAVPAEPGVLEAAGDSVESVEEAPSNRRMDSLDRPLRPPNLSIRRTSRNALARGRAC